MNSPRTYDWIVIGAGITGSALSYELVKQGFSVLLLEKDSQPDNATHYSYGGLAYWSGTTPLTQQLCREGRERHRQLSLELAADTEFQERQLLLTIDADDDPQVRVADFQRYGIAPVLLSVEEAFAEEPLLNPRAIAGALQLPHGLIEPNKTNQAYQQAFQREGGHREIAEVTQLLHQNQRIHGVRTRDGDVHAPQVAICAGGLSGRLLRTLNLDQPNYFTHAQLIQTPPQPELKLRSPVMPAFQSRLALEAEAVATEHQSLWQQEVSQDLGRTLEVGAIQFADGRFCLGQVSTLNPSPQATIDAAESETLIRQGLAQLLPKLANLPGTWSRCLVGFATSTDPQVGAIVDWPGLHLFSGFTSPLVLIPPLAQHFAAWAAGKSDSVMEQLQSSRRS